MEFGTAKQIFAAVTCSEVDKAVERRVLFYIFLNINKHCMAVTTVLCVTILI